MRDAVTAWFGAWVVEHERIVATYPFPTDRTALIERMRDRRDGRLAPEERRLLEEQLPHGLRSRDRRLVMAGAKPGRMEAPEPDPAALGFDPAWLRELLLEEAEVARRKAWDPSVHIEEAVRALRDLDATRNLLGERLASWAGRDGPLEVGELSDSAGAAARRLTQPPPADGGPTRAAPSASLADARRGLAELYLSLHAATTAIEKALEERVPEEAPNLSSLLGPLLTARLIAQAGGLDRLAKLPSSTVQVLGAERAFFEHLRGHAPPPRHGLLFLHPSVQGAPRTVRGKLARALAGKVSIAARLDREGRPVRPDLAAAYEHRTTEVRALGPRRGAGNRAGRASGSPLHRATGDR
jgi:nucleolar protein 56